MIVVEVVVAVINSSSSLVMIIKFMVQMSSAIVLMLWSLIATLPSYFRLNFYSIHYSKWRKGKKPILFEPKRRFIYAWEQKCAHHLPLQNLTPVNSNTPLQHFAPTQYSIDCTEPIGKWAWTGVTCAAIFALGEFINVYGMRSVWRVQPRSFNTSLRIQQNVNA